MPRKLCMVLVGLALSLNLVWATGDGETGGDPSPVPIEIMMPGDRPADFDQVKAEAESRMASDGLNYLIDAAFVPWSDLGNKTRVTLASGEQIDLIFDAPWLHLDQMVSEGYYEPLDDLIAEHGPNLLATRPASMWDANRYGGRIMAIPLGATHAGGRSFHYRADLAQELGFYPVESYDELEEFMYAVRENYPQIIPFSTNPTAVDMSLAHVRVQYDYDAKIRGTEVLPQSLVLYYQGNDGVVYNMFDDMPESIWNYILRSRQLYVDGIINPDLAAGVDANDLMANGRLAVNVSNSVSLSLTTLATLQDAVPGSDLDYFSLYSFEPGDNIIDFRQGNFQAIPVVSENKVDAIKFLDWTNSSQEHYDLLAYGIEGVHWEAVGVDQYRTLETYRFFPYAWIWNPVQERLNAGLSERDLENARFFKEADNFTADILTGFSFDATPVQNEIAVYNNLAGEFYLIMSGIADPVPAWEAFEERAYDAVKAVEIELKRQIDEFLGR